MAGRHPVPAEKKRLRGNPGRRPIPEPATLLPAPGAAVEVPEPSRPLASPGLTLWERAWRHGAAWIAQTDTELLLLACEALDERQTLRQVVLDTGDPSQRQQLRLLERQIASHLGQLGFTPAERTRMGVAEVRAVSALEQVRARRADG